MVYPETSPLLFWHLLTRLGEAQILLPAMVLATAWLTWRQGPTRLALGWLASTTLAATITTLSKVAFIGYGVGLPALDFTGISGHAMFAAAVLPPLLRLSAGTLTGRWQTASLVLGYSLAAAVAVSRVMVGVHSWSEVAAGFALGASASGLALLSAQVPAVRIPRWVPAAVLAWGTLGVAAAPPSRTHDWVTQLALAQSGCNQPYQRWQMHQDHRRHQDKRQHQDKLRHQPVLRPPSLQAR